MFCGLLFSFNHESGDGTQERSLVAERTDVNITVFSESGLGSADITYYLEKEYDDLVFYIPYLIAHQGRTRQYVKLTRCQLIVTNTITEKTEACTLKVAKLVTSQYSEYINSLPSYAKLKGRYKSAVSMYAGAHSSEDVLLHLGSQSSDCQLKLHVEFSMKFDSPLPAQPYFLKPTSSLSRQEWVPHWQYALYNVIPTKHLSYSFTIASFLPIEGVSVPPVAKKVIWKYIKGSKLGRRIVNVACQAQSDTCCYCSFSIVLVPGALSGCYTCITINSESTSLLENDSPQQVRQTFVEQKWDAIVMMSITLSRDQLPLHVQRRQLYPSEFLFVIDCSGSMSGSNIQSAAEMLITCVRSLPNGSYFNIIAFGSHFRQLFHASEIYSKHAVERAVGFANQLQASLGGTDLLPPLQWIFKKACCGMLPRQLFIVTDGGVNNTQQVLSLIRRNRHKARCHTFGIGPEVCVELVTDIAALSCGKCVLLKEGERLQTKVMEVLKESVEPTIMNTMLQWNLPDEYSLIESTPKSFHNMYVGNSYTAYAFLKKTCHSINGKFLTSSAIISGVIGEDAIQLVVKPAVHVLTTAPLDSDSARIVTQTAIWSKLFDLEQVATCSRNEEPKEKTTLSRGGCEYSKCIHKQLVDISLLSNIPTPLTYLISEREGRCKRVVQVLPYGKHVCATQKSVVYRKDRHRRRSHRHHLRRCHFVSSGHTSISLTSIARQTLSNFSSRLKSMVGLFLPDHNTLDTDDIQMLEDEVEYQEKKGFQLQLDDAHNIIYPAFYYNIPAVIKVSSHSEESQTTMLTNKVESSKPSDPVAENEEVEISISDNESDSSVDPDLKPPSDHLPLIHMQLYSGAWPLIRQFSYAVGVPIDEIRNLPLVNECSIQDNYAEDEPNFWSTALAIICLEEHFTHLSAEWEIIAFKGRRWLERNQHVCSLTIDEVYNAARKLIKQT